MPRPPRRRGNLPTETTSFVGRRRELAELRKKLASARLVSLVGPGGVGKTRLAIRAATDLSRAFRDGAWFVELGELRDAGLVGNAVMAALDLRDQAAAEPLALLRSHMRDRELLLVIDNCEHLLGATAALVCELVTSSPGVRVIATSREPLGVHGEHVVPVPPLELPGVPATDPLQELKRNESVTLFVERAAAASGAFELTAANQAAVADLCRRLDGLPLAIELAAVRTRVLSVEQILVRLTDRFGLLTSGSRGALPRHQTLETAIDWSHDLLNPGERALLRRLCVFAGRFTLHDVEAVCLSDLTPRTDGLELITSLVDKSLVVKEDARSVACYRLHETMREYAARKLSDAGEADALASRCTDHYVASAGAQSHQVRFRLLEWLAWTELEIDNIRAVLRRCLVEKDSVRGTALATSMGWYWVTRATSEGVRWLDELLASGPGLPAALAWSYFIRGFLAVLQGDWNGARPALLHAIAAARDAEDAVQLGHALSMASIAESMAGDRDAARRLLQDAQEVAVETDELTVTVAVLQARALNAVFEGDVETLRTVSAEGVRLSREAGDLYALHMMLLNSGTAAFYGGDVATAVDLYGDSLRIAYQLDDRIGQYYVLAAMGCIASMTGRPRVAARLLGASETIRVGAGATVMRFLTPVIDQAVEAATAALGAERFGAELETGRRLDRETAVRLALGDPDRAPKETAGGGADGLLGKREEDVARLIADGLSNKAIARRLFISERTVDSHVRNILNKLGVNSRAQIAAWIASNQSAAPKL